MKFSMAIVALFLFIGGALAVTTCSVIMDPNYVTHAGSPLGTWYSVGEDVPSASHGNHCPNYQNFGNIGVCSGWTSFTDASGAEYLCSDEMQLPVDMPVGATVQIHISARTAVLLNEKNSYYIDLFPSINSGLDCYPLASRLTGLTAHGTPLSTYYGLNKSQIQYHGGSYGAQNYYPATSAFVTIETRMRVARSAGDEVHVCLMATPNVYSGVTNTNAQLLTAGGDAVYVDNTALNFGDPGSKNAVESAVYMDLYPTLKTEWVFTSPFDSSGHPGYYYFNDSSMEGWSIINATNTYATSMLSMATTNAAFYAQSPDIDVSGKNVVRFDVNYTAGDIGYMYERCQPGCASGGYACFGGRGYINSYLIPSTENCDTPTTIIWNQTFYDAFNYALGGKNSVVYRYYAGWPAGCWTVEELWIEGSVPPSNSTQSLARLWHSPLIDISNQTAVTLCFKDEGEHASVPYDAASFGIADIEFYTDGATYVPIDREAVVTAFYVADIGTPSTKEARATIVNNATGLPITLYDPIQETCNIEYAHVIEPGFTLTESFETNAMAYSAPRLKWTYYGPVSSDYGYNMS